MAEPARNQRPEPEPCERCGGEGRFEIDVSAPGDPAPVMVECDCVCEEDES
jgi:hypothetical protein